MLEFHLSDSAALKNMEILKQNQNSVSKYIEENEDSIISYGSEFRPVTILENLLMHHRSWPTL
jgi:hypothetical protein